ncbi:MAG: undecaprenyl-diphosphate phosphatase [Rubricella sp.]
MPLLDLLFLALLQGLTEFLPISSSAHLELFHVIAGEGAEDLTLDVAVHVGSLFAVILYFRTDVARAIRGLGQLLRGRIRTADAFLALCLVIATVPVVIAGAILSFLDLTEMLRSLAVMGWAMILFGVLLWIVDRRAPQEKHAEGWLLKDALQMGLWQVLALIPGTSRAGITITAARLLGYERHDAARLAMLMSIPTIIASGTLLGLDAAGNADWELLRLSAIAAVMAFGAAYAALALMMRLIASVSFTPYIIYRIVLGVILLVIAYG